MVTLDKHVGSWANPFQNNTLYFCKILYFFSGLRPFRDKISRFLIEIQVQFNVFKAK